MLVIYKPHAGNQNFHSEDVLKKPQKYDDLRGRLVAVIK